jgi:probable phosphomutase (TIGR03848 family)
VATVLLLRHGRSTANTAGLLAGWTPDVHLDEVGIAQATAVAARLATLPLTRVVTSPLDRCQETAALAAPGVQAVVEPDLGEVGYGDWTNRPLKELAKEPLWKVVQAHPSAVTFPGGESMAAMQHRAIAAVRAHDAAVTAEAGPDAVWLACSHGDVVKGILADAFGMHLDAFQRIVVDPASVSVVRYTATRPFVLATNDTGGDLARLRPRPRRTRRPRASVDAEVGGGAGPRA